MVKIKTIVIILKISDLKLKETGHMLKEKN